MILIVPDLLEAKLAIGDSDIKYEENLVVYKQLCEIYEKNFYTYLEATNNAHIFDKNQAWMNEHYMFDPNNPYQPLLKKLKDQFDVIRPYIYFIDECYYFFRSRSEDLKNANIFKIEETEILEALEIRIKHGYMDTQKRKTNKIPFMVNAKNCT